MRRNNWIDLHSDIRFKINNFTLKTGDPVMIYGGLFFETRIIPINGFKLSKLEILDRGDVEDVITWDTPLVIPKGRFMIHYIQNNTFNKSDPIQYDSKIIQAQGMPIPEKITRGAKLFIGLM